MCSARLVNHLGSVRSGLSQVVQALVEAGNALFKRLNHVLLVIIIIVMKKTKLIITLKFLIISKTMIISKLTVLKLITLFKIIIIIKVIIILIIKPIARACVANIFFKGLRRVLQIV